MQLAGLSGEYFTAPELFATSVVREFSDFHASIKFATVPTEYRLFNGSSSVDIYLVPLEVGQFPLTSSGRDGLVRPAMFDVVATEADLNADTPLIDATALSCGGEVSLLDMTALGPAMAPLSADDRSLDDLPTVGEEGSSAVSVTAAAWSVMLAAAAAAFFA